MVTESDLKGMSQEDLVDLAMQKDAMVQSLEAKIKEMSQENESKINKDSEAQLEEDENKEEMKEEDKEEEEDKDEKMKEEEEEEDKDEKMKEEKKGYQKMSETLPSAQLLSGR